MTDLLLDTCAFIWASIDAPLQDDATEAIRRTEADGGSIWVSPVTAWELGMLVSRGRLRSSKPPLAWFEAFLAETDARLAPMPPNILVDSSFLPDGFHSDPMDRILIATAREQGLTIVTRDRAILNYGREGHVNVLPC